MDFGQKWRFNVKTYFFLFLSVTFVGVLFIYLIFLFTSLRLARAPNVGLPLLTPQNIAAWSSWFWVRCSFKSEWCCKQRLDWNWVWLLNSWDGFHIFAQFTFTGFFYLSYIILIRCLNVIVVFHLSGVFPLWISYITRNLVDSLIFTCKFHTYLQTYTFFLLHSNWCMYIIKLLFVFMHEKWM